MTQTSYCISAPAKGFFGLCGVRTHARTRTFIDETINVNFPKQPVSGFPFLSNLVIRGISLMPLCLLSRSLACRFLSVLPLFFFFPHAVCSFLGSPGDTVLLSCLTNRHRQNESSSVLPKAGLCPRGGLPGRISMRPVGSVCTDCDKPGAAHSSYIK